jgi:hypothetical protein
MRSFICVRKPTISRILSQRHEESSCPIPFTKTPAWHRVGGKFSEIGESRRGSSNARMMSAHVSSVGNDPALLSRLIDAVFLAEMLAPSVAPPKTPSCAALRRALMTFGRKTHAWPDSCSVEATDGSYQQPDHMLVERQ